MVGEEGLARLYRSQWPQHFMAGVDGCEMVAEKPEVVWVVFEDYDAKGQAAFILAFYFAWCLHVAVRLHACGLCVWQIKKGTALTRDRPQCFPYHLAVFACVEVEVVGRLEYQFLVSLDCDFLLCAWVDARALGHLLYVESTEVG